MKITDHLLVCLSEECSELAQRATKAIRFGIDEVQKDQAWSNSDRIILEFNDILAVAELLEEEGALSAPLRVQGLIDQKKEKLRRWMEYSHAQGTLENPSLPSLPSVQPSA